MVLGFFSETSDSAGCASGGSGGCSSESSKPPWFHIKIWEMDRNCLLYISLIYVYICIYLYIIYNII